MRDIQAGDVCTGCGQKVREQTTTSGSLAGDRDIVRSWTCGCDTLAGPQVPNRGE